MMNHPPLQGIEYPMFRGGMFLRRDEMDGTVIEKCPACGSDGLVRNITMSQSVEVGGTGLEYKTGVIIRSTESLLADLCTRCGTVVRLHVRNPDRNWITKP
jgi:predicted RNA-binding Zn-ribbon protein involved in translation (DUF1610 family)